MYFKEPILANDLVQYVQGLQYTDVQQISEHNSRCAIILWLHEQTMESSVHAANNSSITFYD